jgi:hypothetical protein
MDFQIEILQGPEFVVILSPMAQKHLLESIFGPGEHPVGFPQAADSDRDFRRHPRTPVVRV